MKKIVNHILDWTWQLPQNIVGFIYSLCIKTTKYEDNPYDDCIIYNKKSKGCVTLGKYIFVYRYKYNKAQIIKHEYGHRIQSKILGPLYLFVIGLPSIIWANEYHNTSNKSYYDFYTESWANKLGGYNGN